MKEITARQKEIVAAALAIISERGLEALTIKNIAARVGFSDAAVYRHFRNKAQILSTIIDLFASSSARLLDGDQRLRLLQPGQGQAVFPRPLPRFFRRPRSGHGHVRRKPVPERPGPGRQDAPGAGQPPPACCSRPSAAASARKRSATFPPSTCSPWSWARCACWSCNGGPAATASTCCAPGKNSGARWKHSSRNRKES